MLGPYTSDWQGTYLVATYLGHGNWAHEALFDLLLIAGLGSGISAAALLKKKKCQSRILRSCLYSRHAG